MSENGVGQRRFAFLIGLYSTYYIEHWRGEKTRYFRFFACVLGLMCWLCANGEQLRDRDATAWIFFVATNGNDQWSGRLESPNMRKTDGPFATLPRALQAIREEKQRPLTILLLRKGYYFLTEPLILKPKDSRVEFSAYRNEQPIISGGRRITGWKE